jgi:hypothetical protein
MAVVQEQRKNLKDQISSNEMLGNKQMQTQLDIAKVNAQSAERVARIQQEVPEKQYQLDVSRFEMIGLPESAIKLEREKQVIRNLEEDELIKIQEVQLKAQEYWHTEEKRELLKHRTALEEVKAYYAKELVAAGIGSKVVGILTGGAAFLSFLWALRKGDLKGAIEAVKKKLQRSGKATRSGRVKKEPRLNMDKPEGVSRPRVPLSDDEVKALKE